MVMECLKTYKYTMLKITIPIDHQKYHQREFPLDSGRF